MTTPWDKISEPQRRFDARPVHFTDSFNARLTINHGPCFSFVRLQCIATFCLCAPYKPTLLIYLLGYIYANPFFSLNYVMSIPRNWILLGHAAICSMHYWMS